MKNKKIKIILFVLIIGVLSLAMFCFNWTYNSKSKTVLENTIINSGNRFAIYVRENPNSDYKFYKRSIWPFGNYRYEKAICYDREGNELSEEIVKNIITVSDPQIILDSNVAVQCDMYFVKKPENLLDSLRWDDTNHQISDALVGGMYRYKADDDITNNYICFGISSNCSTNDANKEKYMYRILGITPEGELYLAKNSSINNVQYHSTNTSITWIDSDLYKNLNDSLFYNNTNYIPTSWKSKIEQKNYYYGNVGTEYWTSEHTMEQLYEIEHGLRDSEWTENGVKKTGKWTSINAYIGIPTLTDIFYTSRAVNADSSMRINNINYPVGILQSFLTDINKENGTEEMFVLDKISPDTLYTLNATTWLSYAMNVGNESILGIPLTTSARLRPVFYLKNNITIESGIGSETDPYLIA